MNHWVGGFARVRWERISPSSMMTDYAVMCVYMFNVLQKFLFMQIHLS